MPTSNASHSINVTFARFRRASQQCETMRQVLVHRVRCCDIGSGKLRPTSCPARHRPARRAGVQPIRSLPVVAHGSQSTTVALVRQPRQAADRNRPGVIAKRRQPCDMRFARVIVVRQDHHIAAGEMLGSARLPVSSTACVACRDQDPDRFRASAHFSPSTTYGSWRLAYWPQGPAGCTAGARTDRPCLGVNTARRFLRKSPWSPSLCSTRVTSQRQLAIGAKVFVRRFATSLERGCAASLDSGASATKSLSASEES